MAVNRMAQPLSASNICYNRYMALNLRKIDPDLHRRLKLAAFSSGKALERFCLDALEECLGAGERHTQKSALAESATAHSPRIAGSNPAPPTKSALSSHRGYVPPRFRA